jgi:hypothetical protein
MIRIHIEADTALEIAELLNLRDSERDALKARVAHLEHEPLRFSRENLAREVIDDYPSLTPTQRLELRARIETKPV